MSTLRYWAWLSSLAGLKPKTRSELIEAFGDPEKVFFADDKTLSEHVLLNDRERTLLADKNLDRADRILEKCSEEGILVYTIGDSAYPLRLRNIYDPPIMLYVKGRLPAVDEEAVIAVVGTRNASPYGIKMGRSMAFDICRGGGIVATGLAAGVDSAAAEGALRAGGRCIGVLGCAIDEVYPKYNGELYGDVSSAGALVSEYPPGTPTEGKNFPERNRIISGLSVGVTIVEAPRGSGSIITATRALDQGREVFVVPGNADAVNCIGSNELIKEGAALVTCGWDVLGEFEQRFPSKIKKPDGRAVPAFAAPAVVVAGTKDSAQKSEPETGRGFAKLREKTPLKKVDKKNEREYIDLKGQLSGLTDNQLKIVSVMGERAKHIDDIIDEAELPASAVLSEMTVLQIKGFVVQESGKRFSLNIKNYK